MRTKILLIVVVAIVCLTAYHSEGLGGQLQVVHSIDFADPDHGLGDLGWDGHYLLAPIQAPLEGGVFALDPLDGSIVRQLAPASWVTYRGLAWDGRYVWTTGSPNTIAPASEVLDFVERIDADAMPGPVKTGFGAPHTPNARQNGAAWDGEHLWLSDLIHQEIMQLDPADMSVISSFASPGSEPLGLAFDGSSLWCADGADQLIYQIDMSGDVVEAWSLPDGIDPYGLTFDGQYLWVADNTARQIFQLAIPEPSSVGLLISGALAVLLLAWQSQRQTGKSTETSPTFFFGVETMRRTVLLIVMTTAARWSFCEQDAHAGTLQLVHSIDLPFEPGAGGATDLAWDGEHVWASTYDLLRGFRTYEFDPSDGSAVSWFYTEPPNTFGLAWDGDSLWNTVWRGNGPHPIPPSEDFIERRATDGSLLKRLDAPHSPFGYPAGATWDGTYLWLSDAQWQQLIQVDPRDGRVIKTLSFPPRDPRGLAWDGVSLWAVSGADGLIYQMDTSGNVQDTWISPAIDPYGVTFDGQYLWVSDSGTGTGKILQLAIPEPSTLALLGGAVVSLAYLSFRRPKRFGQAKYPRTC